MGRLQSEVAGKLCCKMVQVFKDIGVDILALGPIVEEPNSPYDYGGVDFLATTMLSGISKWFAELHQECWTQQPWFKSFHEFLQLLRQ
jgi:hypothetical protein